MKTISGKKVLWQVVVVVAVSILWTWGVVRPDDASAVTDACKLLSAGEIEAVVGEKVNMPLSGQSADPKPGMSSVCYPIKAGIYTVTVRFGKKTADSGKKEEAGLEIAKKMGMKITVEKHGNTTCSTAIPLVQKTDPRSTMGFNTTCAVDKGGFIVGVEVTAPSEAKMVPPAKIQPLAEKAAARL